MKIKYCVNRCCYGGMKTCSTLCEICRRIAFWWDFTLYGRFGCKSKCREMKLSYKMIMICYGIWLLRYANRIICYIHNGNVLHVKWPWAKSWTFCIAMGFGRISFYDTESKFSPHVCHLYTGNNLFSNFYWSRVSLLNFKINWNFGYLMELLVELEFFCKNFWEMVCQSLSALL